MKHDTFGFILLFSIVSAVCLALEEPDAQHSCLLQVQNKRSKSEPIKEFAEKLPAEREHLEPVKLMPSAPIQEFADNLAAEHKQLEPVKFMPVQGFGGSLKAGVDGVCATDGYFPSLLEQNFSANVAEWTQDSTSLCEHLGTRHTWIQENMEGKLNSGEAIFSRLCKKGKAPQLLEPLAGILRDPRMICDGSGIDKVFGIDWLVLADHGGVTSSAKNIIFDAGGSMFMDSMAFFTAQYEKRGLVLDKIFVWEAEPRGTEAYWEGTPPEVRQRWEPRLTFYDGVPVSADPKAQHNPLSQILAECRPDDFCTFKLDIDTPSVELPIVEQLLNTPAATAVLDEFFFEHHVAGLMQPFGWAEKVNGTFADSYAIFGQLRKMGVRAHSWI